MHKQSWSLHQFVIRLGSTFQADSAAIMNSTLILLFFALGQYNCFYLQECQAKFSTDPLENLKYIQMYPRGDSGPYIARFTSDHSDIKDYPVDSPKLPPLVTAATSAQFYQLQGFIQHIHVDLKKEHSDVKLIVYDLGLYRREREIVSG